MVSAIVSWVVQDFATIHSMSLLARLGNQTQVLAPTASEAKPDGLGASVPSSGAPCLGREGLVWGLLGLPPLLPQKSGKRKQGSVARPHRKDGVLGFCTSENINLRAELEVDMSGTHVRKKPQRAQKGPTQIV